MNQPHPTPAPSSPPPSKPVGASWPLFAGIAALGVLYYAGTRLDPSRPPVPAEQERVQSPTCILPNGERSQMTLSELIVMTPPGGACAVPAAPPVVTAAPPAVLVKGAGPAQPAAEPHDITARVGPPVPIRPRR